MRPRDWTSSLGTVMGAAHSNNLELSRRIASKNDSPEGAVSILRVLLDTRFRYLSRQLLKELFCIRCLSYDTLRGAVSPLV